MALLACALAFATMALVAAPAAHATFVGKVGKIAFSSDRDSPPACPECFRGERDVFVMNADGTAQVNLTDPSSGAMPAWSPNGVKLAFELEGNLWVMNANGTGATQLTHFNDCCTKVFDPSWSPDNLNIVYSRTEPVFDEDLQEIVTGPMNLYVAAADGSNTDRVTNTTAVDEMDPAWSPDNLKILFDTPDGLEIMNPDGSARTSLGVIGSTPSWSPDGSRVAFTQDGDVWLMNPDGTGLLQLTTDPADDRWPAWSPDRTKIAFASDRDGTYEIYVMNADGTAQAPLTTDHLLSPPAEAIDPDWQPVGAFDLIPRPGSASPLRIPLVPSYQTCSEPNSQHVTPLDLPSCTPASVESPVLTTSAQGRQAGFMRLDAMLGNDSTPEDEADLRIFGQITDVRCVQTSAACPGGASSDFEGKVLLRAAIRLTDRANGFGGLPGTVSDTTFDVPIDCIATANPLFGSTCDVDTTADTLIPNYVRETKRTIISALELSIRDPGPNGTGYGPSCPSTCGDGDETTYMREGLFVP